MARISITNALGDRRDWLEHQAEGSLSVRRKALHDLVDAAQTEARTRIDYAGRYPIELLQNAHDACADANVTGTVRFVVTQHALLVANEGRPFDGRRIVSLVRQGSSEKAEERFGRRTIGYKGIGFSSVFEITDRPQVISAGQARFEFDRARARALVKDALRLHPKDVAARAFPFPLAPDDWADDASDVDALLASGAVTVIRLPFRRRVTPSDVAEGVEGALHPEVLLFMPAVEAIGLQLLGRGTRWARRRGKRFKKGAVIHLDENGERARSWLISGAHVRIAPDEAQALEEPAWEQVKRAEIVVGLPWEGGVSAEEVSAPIHVYFPTEERIGRSVLVHGDFFIDSRRASITLKGLPGELNRRMATKAARLLAELAESQSRRYGREVCSALAQHESATSFGELLGNDLVEALKAKRLLPVLGREQPVRVARARRVTDLDEDWEGRLLELTRRKQGLVRPGIVAGRAADLLDELGLEALEPQALVARLGVPTKPKRYERALATLDEWLDELPWNEQEAATSALAARPTLLDRSGHLRRARDVVLSIGDVPSLPPALARHELRPLADDAAASLVERLEVEHLDAEVALDVMLTALEERRYGRSANEHAVVLRFLEALWKRARTAFEGVGERLGVVRVPARTARGPDAQWVKAKDVYLGREWGALGKHLDAVYGPLGEPEFFASTPSKPPAQRGRQAAFYVALGVAARPRMVALTDELPRYSDWLEQPEVRTAFECPDGHADYYQEVATGAVIDRLDVLIARSMKDNSFALAHLLNALEAPYGEGAGFRCGHSSHRSRPRVRPALGYQRWRLRAVSWVPVRDDPDARRRRPPAEAWAGVPRRAGQLLLPTVDLEDPRPALELVPWSQPPPEAVEHAISLLRKAELDRSEVITSADRLLKKLETALARERGTRKAPALLCHLGKSREWADNPVVPDLPRLERLSELAALPVGDWPNLRRVYELLTASSVVQQTIKAGPKLRGLPELLPRANRARLLAVLSHSRDEDMSSIATRLARIREHPVRGFELRLTMDGDGTAMRTLAVHLVERPRKRGGLPLADLYFTPVARENTAELVSLLQTYLRTSDFEALWFALTATDQALSEKGITQADIREARELLSRRRPPPGERPEHLILDDSIEEPPWEPPDANGERSPHTRKRGGRDQTMELPSPPAEELEFGEAVALAPVVTESGSGMSVAPASDAAADLSGDANAPEPEGGVAPTPASSQGQRDDPPPTETDPSSGGPPNADGAGTEPTAEDIGIDVDRKVEKQAVNYAVEYARRELGATVNDVQKDRLGWDLEFDLPDGRQELVEVKGRSGSGAFALTRNELRQAKTRSNWVLYYAFDLASPTPSLVRITGFRSLREDELVVPQYSLPGWRTLHCEQIALRKMGMR